MLFRSDLTGPASIFDRDAHAIHDDFAPVKRSYRGAFAGGVTVVAAAVMSWVFVGWTPYSGSAEARRDESIKPVSLTPTKARDITPALSTLDLPTLSLRMRLAEPMQPPNGDAARDDQKR